MIINRSGISDNQIELKPFFFHFLFSVIIITLDIIINFLSFFTHKHTQTFP